MTEVVQPVAEDHQGVGSVKDHPTPQIAPDEVLVKVEFAASVRVCKLWRGL
jgi:NADPH:quinone reductase-like Zn-dependent oxidoreductase